MSLVKSRWQLLFSYITFGSTCWGESSSYKLITTLWCGCMHNFKEPESQLARWLERLEEFYFDMIHCRGKAHCNADALSRMSSRDSNDTSDVFPIANIALTPVVRSRSCQDIRSLQLEDELVGPIFVLKLMVSSLVWRV